MNEIALAGLRMGGFNFQYMIIGYFGLGKNLMFGACVVLRAEGRG